MKLIQRIILPAFFLIGLFSIFHCGGASQNLSNQNGSGGSDSSKAILASLSEHPRILISPNRLEVLRNKVRSNSSDWIALKGKCDNLVADATAKEAKIGVWDEAHELYSLGLCYQLLRTTDLTQAEKYANRGKEYLLFIVNDSLDPLWNKGYALRFRVVGMAIGFDWLYPSLSTEEKINTYNTINRWIGAIRYNWEWNAENPQGNYYAGYYAAKGLAGLATYGDNPKAEEIWNEFYQRDHLENVQPYYAKYLAGGGWPEGWNYGPLGTYNMTLPAYAIKSATDKDLLKPSNHPFLFPLDQAKQLIHFSWPTLISLDDRGTMRPLDDPSKNPVYLLTFLTSVLREWQDDFAPVFQSYVRSIRQETKDRSPAWQEFLFWNDSAAEKDYRTQPLSYFSSGMNTVAMRSSWDKQAVWASFTAGQYVNNSWSGEQYYDQGSLAIRRGDTPILVNPIGALMRNTPGLKDNNGNPFEDSKVSIKKKDENGKEFVYSLSDAIYDNLYKSPYQRDLFNIFLISSSRLGQIATPLEISNSHISRYEEDDQYVAITGTGLEDQYRVNAEQTRFMKHWTREVNYLRNDQLFILFDRTQVSDPNFDQWMNFHLGADQRSNLSEKGVGFYSFTKSGKYVGKVLTVFPENRLDNVENLYGEFGINKVLRLKINVPKGTTDHLWLTVFDASSESNSVTQAEKIVSVSGANISGVFLKNPTRQWVVLFSNDFAEQPIHQPIQFDFSQAGLIHLIVNNLPPNTNFEVQRSGSSVRISASEAGRFQSSAQGVLLIENL